MHVASCPLAAKNSGHRLLEATFNPTIHSYSSKKAPTLRQTTSARTRSPVVTATSTFSPGSGFAHAAALAGPPSALQMEPARLAGRKQPRGTGAEEDESVLGSTHRPVRRLLSAATSVASPSSAAATHAANSHYEAYDLRAPEMLLSQPYSSSADMWSVGCLMAFLLRKVCIRRNLYLLSMVLDTVQVERSQSPPFPLSFGISCVAGMGKHPMYRCASTKTLRVSTEPANGQLRDTSHCQHRLENMLVLMGPLTDDDIAFCDMGTKVRPR
jgi:serine/threonine protein kinase